MSAQFNVHGTVSETTGTLVLTVYDPAAELQTVRFDVTDATGAVQTAQPADRTFPAGSAAPTEYQKDVVLSADRETRIETVVTLNTGTTTRPGGETFPRTTGQATTLVQGNASERGTSIEVGAGLTLGRTADGLRPLLTAAGTPVVSWNPTQQGSTGILTVEVEDTTQAVTEVVFQVKEGSAAWAIPPGSAGPDGDGWAAGTDAANSGAAGTDAALFRRQTVPLERIHNSAIKGEVRYRSNEGMIRAVPFGWTFDLDTEPEVDPPVARLADDGTIGATASGDEDCAKIYLRVGEAPVIGAGDLILYDAVIDVATDGRSAYKGLGVRCPVGESRTVYACGWNAGYGLGEAKLSRVRNTGSQRDPGGNLVLDYLQGLISVEDSQTTPVTRVRLGRLGSGLTEYGLQVHDDTGKLILGASGLGVDVVKSANIAEQSITAAKIAAGTITANEIKTGSITADKIVAGSITAREIAADSITAREITAGSITANEIAAGSISGDRIAAGSVSANHIVAGSITGDRIAATAISAGHLVAGAVTTTKLAASSVTADKVAVTALSSITSNLGTVTAGTLQDAQGKFIANLGAALLTIQDAQAPPRTRVRLGKLATGVADYGLEVLDQNGKLILGASGLGTSIVGAGQIADGAVVASKLTEDSRGWVITTGFAAPAYNKVTWTAGKIRFSDGTEYAVPSGQIGAMTAGLLYYVFFNKAASAFQSTTNYAAATGSGKVMVAVAKAASSTSESAFYVPGGQGILELPAEGLKGGKLPAGVLAPDGAALESTTGAALKVNTSFRGELLKNPLFADWTGARPAGWDTLGLAPTKEQALTRYGGQAVRFVSPTAADNTGLVAQYNNANLWAADLANPAYLMVECDVRFVSGVAAGSAIVMDWVLDTGASSRVILRFDQELGLTPELGKWFNIRRVIARPAGFAGVFAGLRMYLMGNWAVSQAGGGSAKEVLFDRVLVREAAAPEVAASLGLNADGTVSAGKVGTASLQDEAIVAGKLAPGAVDSAKLAAGLSLIEVSTAASLPTAKTAEVITWQDKLYRWNGSAYIASVPAVDVTGQLVGGQIANSAIADPHISDVNGGKITARSIRTAALAAGAVTANEIAANTITAANISAGAIGVNHLAAGSVTGDKITGGSISGDKITGGAVATGHLAAGAVTTAKLAAGAVTANEIAANTITAGKLAANSVTSLKLVVGIADNVIPNPDFKTGDLTNWRPTLNPSGVSVVSRTGTSLPAGAPTQYVARLQAAGTTTSLFSHEGYHTALADGVPCAPGQKYLLSFMAAAANNTGGVLEAQVYYYRADGNVAGSGTIVTVQPTSNSWLEYAAAFTVPALAVKFHVYFFAAGLSGAYGITQVTVKRQSGTTLIEDNAITTGKVAAGAITADKVEANAITASKINVAQLSAISADLGTITAGMMRNSADTTGVLLSGSLPGTWQNYLNLSATGSAPFLQHGVLSLNADGTGAYGDSLLLFALLGI